MAGPWERYGGEQERKPWERYGAGDDTVSAFFSGAADSASFGFGDELQGLVFGKDAREASRQRQEDYRARHGGAFLAGQVGGALASTAATGGLGAAASGARGVATVANLARNVGPMGRIAIGAGAGAAGGAAYGAGDARDGDRLRSAGQGALWGAAGGGAGHALLGEFAPFVAGKVMQGMSPETRAAKFMAETLNRHGQDGAAIERNLLEQGPMGGTLMDAVRGGPELVNQAGVRPSASKLAARETFDARNNAAGRESIDDVWQTLNGTARTTADDVVSGLEDVQKKSAKPFYDEAYKKTVQPSSLMSSAREVMRRHPALFKSAEAFAKARQLARTGSEALDFNSPQVWHDILEGANTELGKRLQAGAMGNLQGFRGSQSFDYSKAVGQFDTMVRRMLGPEFRKAQDIYSGAAKSQAAVQRGYDLFGSGVNDLKLGDTLRWMKTRASRAEIEHMRMGVLSKISNMLENADTQSGKADVVRAIVRNQGQRRALESLFGGTGKLDDLLKRLNIRRDLFDNTARTGIGVNSHTADRLLGAQAQQASTRPTGAGFADMIYRTLMRESADRFDERVSDQVIGAMTTPADEALKALRSGGGVGGALQKRGLLSRALREAEAAQKRRPAALRNALIGGLYYAPASQGAGQYGASF